MVWEVKTYPWQDPQKSFTSNSVRNHLRVGDLQLFDLIGAFLNVSEEEMSIRMSRAAAPYWVSFNHNKIVAQLCNGWRAPYAESVLKAVHEDYFALTCGQSQHFWRRGDSGNLSDTREAYKVIEHFMYCESSVWPGRKAQDINFSTPLRYRQPHQVGETGSQQKDLALGVITPNDLSDCCCPRWMWRSCMRRTDCGRCHEAHRPSEQKLMVSKFRWQELSPYTPSNRSSKELIYSTAYSCVVFVSPSWVTRCSQSSIIARDGP